jgi:hypothetical protein
MKYLLDVAQNVSLKEMGCYIISSKKCRVTDPELNEYGSRPKYCLCARISQLNHQNVVVHILAENLVITIRS